MYECRRCGVHTIDSDDYRWRIRFCPVCGGKRKCPPLTQDEIGAMEVGLFELGLLSADGKSNPVDPHLNWRIWSKENQRPSIFEMAVGGVLTAGLATGCLGIVGYSIFIVFAILDGCASCAGGAMLGPGM